MKMPWLAPVATVLLLVGCSPDRTLETLVPKNALAVVLVDQPSLTAALLGPPSGDLPWAALDGGKPWAAAVVPADPPGFLLVLALADKPQAWVDTQAWARERGGMTALRVGAYAVLSSPGLPAAKVLEPDQRYDLSRVRTGGELVSVYLDVQNLWANAASGGPLGILSAVPPQVKDNLAGLRIGFSGRTGGAELRVSTDWKAGSSLAQDLKPRQSPADLGPWTGHLPRGDGFGLAASLTPRDWEAPAEAWDDPALAARWTALVPLLGPRVAVAMEPRADGTWSWAAAVESRDPQAVRQALKTLVASGDLQRHFPKWALDADTALIYRDRPDGFGGVLASVTLGESNIQMGYGVDRVSLAGGFGAEDHVRTWRKPAAVSAPWAAEVPSGVSLAASGTLDGLGARASLGARADGNWELRVWVDAAGLKVWEERLPQVLRSWMAGQGGVTILEP